MMDSEPITKEMKVEAVRALLKECDSILVWVLNEVEGVTLPDYIKAANEVTVLELGLDMKTPIPDLVVSPLGITATLSFARSPFFVTLPWEAIGMVRAKDGGEPKAPEKAERRLTAVPMDAPFDAEAAGPSNAVQARPALRLVRSDDRDGPAGGES